ncbi:unnamed protein product [Lactuca virosa]|uniref:Uncharacterized protein n=1 Tax=Lactuca virosa TaxID=75947 RepID=A0AAU9PGS8_9ASTR|nr:unnamed protein product [Lactuca virosa]
MDVQAKFEQLAQALSELVNPLTDRRATAPLQVCSAPASFSLLPLSLAPVPIWCSLLWASSPRVTTQVLNSWMHGQPTGLKQPTPISWEKCAGTDWSMVTTNDGKRYLVVPYIRKVCMDHYVAFLRSSCKSFMKVETMMGTHTVGRLKERVKELMGIRLR